MVAADLKHHQRAVIPLVKVHASVAVFPARQVFQQEAGAAHDFRIARFPTHKQAAQAADGGHRVGGPPVLGLVFVHTAVLAFCRDFVQELDRALEPRAVHPQPSHLGAFELHHEPARDREVRVIFGCVSPAAVRFLMAFDGVFQGFLGGLARRWLSGHAIGLGQRQTRDRVMIADAVRAAGADRAAELTVAMLLFDQPFHAAADVVLKTARLRRMPGAKKRQHC